MTVGPRCQDNGLLVNGKALLPDDPRQYRYVGSLGLVGCNQLRCTACLSPVRQEPGVWVNKAGADARQLYAADWATSPNVGKQPIARLYACPCGWWNQTTDGTLLDEDDPSRPTPPWGCAGHPPLTLPCELDGVPLAPGNDLPGLVRRVLLDGESAPKATDGERALGFIWLLKLHQMLAASTNGEGLAPAVPRAMADLWAQATEVEARANIIEFFRFLPDAPGAEDLLSRFLSHPAEVVGQRRPPRCEPKTLEELFNLLLRARVQLLQAQGRSLDERLVEVVARGLLDSRRRVKLGERGAKQVAGEWLETLRAAVACSDAPFAARAEALVKGDPTLALPLLQALHQAQSVRLLDVAARVSALPGVDAKALVKFGDQVGGQVKAALRAAT